MWRISLVVCGHGEKIKHNDLNCNLSSAGSGLAGIAVVSFPLGQHSAVCGAACVGGLFVVTGQSKGEGRLAGYLKEAQYDIEIRRPGLT